MSHDQPEKYSPTDVFDAPPPAFPTPIFARKPQDGEEPSQAVDDGSSFQEFPGSHLAGTPSDIKTDTYLGVELIVGTVPASYKGYKPKQDVNEIYDACRGLGTRNTKLVKVLAPLCATNMQILQSQYMVHRQTDLLKLLRNESSGLYKKGLTLLASGPLAGDTYLLKQAQKRKNNDISLQMLTDLIVARPKSEIALLSQYVAVTMHTNLRRLVMDMIPAKLRMVRDVFDRCFELEVPEYKGSNFQEDLKTLRDFFADTTRPLETNKVIAMIIDRPPRDLNRLCRYWQENNFGESLAKTIKRCLTHEAADVLAYAVHAAEVESYMGRYDLGVWRDAQGLEDAITNKKDFLLTYRLIRAHWDAQRFRDVVAAFGDIKANKITLVNRIKGATSGNLEILLKEIVKVAV